MALGCVEAPHFKAVAKGAEDVGKGLWGLRVVVTESHPLAQ